MKQEESVIYLSRPPCIAMNKQQRHRDRCHSAVLNLTKGVSRDIETGTHYNSDCFRRYFHSRTEFYLWLLVLVLFLFWLMKSYWEERAPIVDDVVLPSEMKWGENGRGVTIFPYNLSRVQEQEMIDGMRNHGYNTFVGDRISLRRELPGLQSPLCGNLWSSVSLQASVVIVYHDEAWSTLMRTIFSVLDRSEPHLLKDVIIVDNASLNPKVNGLIVERYLSLYSKSKVKLVHLPRLHNLWQARAIGAKEASGDVLIFLHSRCECSQGWLSPLLGRLEENSQVIAVPNVDIIDPLTFEYQRVMSVHDIRVGSFTWNLEKTVKQPQYAYGDEEIPIPTPVIKDGVIAVTKTFFSAVGAALPWCEEKTENCTLSDQDDYNADIDDINLSFRVWMCGGSIEIIPCSHVGLIFQKWLTRTQHVNYRSRNRRKLVLAGVLMDEFEQHVHDRIEGERPAANDAILKKYQSLRQRLKCHNFSWFLHNVEKTLKNPPLVARRGKLKHQNPKGDEPLLLGRQGFHVQLDYQDTNPATLWYFTEESFLVTDDDMCLTVCSRSSRVLLTPCDVMSTIIYSDIWILTERGQLKYNQTQLCLGINNGAENKSLQMVRCDHIMAAGNWFLSLS